MKLSSKRMCVLAEEAALTPLLRVSKQKARKSLFKSFIKRTSFQQRLGTRRDTVFAACVADFFRVPWLALCFQFVARAGLVWYVLGSARFGVVGAGLAALQGVSRLASFLSTYTHIHAYMHVRQDIHTRPCAGNRSVRSSEMSAGV